MKDNKPKLLTKAELRAAATRDLKVSKNSFDFAWILAIEETGRNDWYEPLHRYAVFDYFPAVRNGDRVTVKGDKPFYEVSVCSGMLRSPGIEGTAWGGKSA